MLKDALVTVYLASLSLSMYFYTVDGVTIIDMFVICMLVASAVSVSFYLILKWRFDDLEVLYFKSLSNLKHRLMRDRIENLHRIYRAVDE